jgi:hypothetical protein
MTSQKSDGGTAVSATSKIYASVYSPAGPTGNDAASVETASQALKTVIVGAQDAGNCIYECIEALHQFGCEHPPAIDLALSIFQRAIALLPSTLETTYGKGSGAGTSQLIWWLIEESMSFQGDVEPRDVGVETVDEPASSERSLDTIDGSNVNFGDKDIRSNLSLVLTKLMNFKKERLALIVSLALQARCHALDVARLNRGDHAGDHAMHLIRNALDPLHQGTPRWSKVDFIACCILLRGCARSLLQTIPGDHGDTTLQSWRDGLVAFINNDNGTQWNQQNIDFAIKAHAAVSFHVQEVGRY